MRFCHECGVKVLDDEAKFCIECGANLSAEKSSPSPKPATPVKTAPPPKSSSPVSVAKGQRVDLTKSNPALKNLLVGLGWRKADNFDIDAAAFLLGANGKVAVETDFIFYNNPLHDSEAVEHLDDSGDDNEQFRLDLEKIPSGITKIAFTLTIHDADTRRQNFGQVVDAFIRVADKAGGKELLRYELGKNFSTETAIVVAELYRNKGEWKFNAIGAGFSGGLAALYKNFGIDVAS